MFEGFPASSVCTTFGCGLRCFINSAQVLVPLSCGGAWCDKTEQLLSRHALTAKRIRNDMECVELREFTINLQLSQILGYGTRNRIESKKRVAAVVVVVKSWS